MSGFGEAARSFTLSGLEEAFGDMEPQIKEIRSNLEGIVHSVQDFKERHAKNINVDEISAVLVKELDKIFQSLQTPPDQAPSHEERQKRVEDLLGQVEEMVIRVLTSAGVPHSQAREFMNVIHPHIATLTVTTGKGFFIYLHFGAISDGRVNQAISASYIQSFASWSSLPLRHTSTESCQSSVVF